MSERLKYLKNSKCLVGLEGHRFQGRFYWRGEEKYVEIGSSILRKATILWHNGWGRGMELIYYAMNL